MTNLGTSCSLLRRSCLPAALLRHHCP
jgi:hypothetical protein